MSNSTLERTLGRRFFTKGDGKVYLTLPTGKVGEDGKPVYEDRVMSDSAIDASAALTVTEYKQVDTVVTEIAKTAERFTAWMLSLTGCVDRFDGLKRMTYWYQRRTGNTSSRMTMNLEDDAPGTTISTEEDGVPLPLEFADWSTSIRSDPVASASAGEDVAAQKAAGTADAVATGLDLRQLNGWGGLTYHGVTVYGWRDVPTNLTVAQKTGGWLSDAVSVTDIYNDIVKMVNLADAAKIPGPFVLMTSRNMRKKLAQPYSVTANGVVTTLWDQIMGMGRVGAGAPSVLDISQIKLVPQMDELKGGGTPTVGEAYLTSLSAKYFRVLSYLPMQSFTMDLKGAIATKHRMAEGVCPLFKKDWSGNYGVVKLVAPAD
jgi:hypothetical protein